MTAVRLNGSLAAFQNIGRGRLRISVAGAWHDLYDLDFVKVTDAAGIAAVIEDAINAVVPSDAEVSVGYAAGALAFSSGAGAVALEGSQARANERSHVLAYIGIGDGAAYPATRGLHPDIWGGSWTSQLAAWRIAHLNGLTPGRMRHFAYNPCGFDTPGYLAGYYGPTGDAVYCAESGPRHLESVAPGAVSTFVASWSPLVAASAQTIFHVGAPDYLDGTGWLTEVLAAGGDVGMATCGGLKRDSDPVPAAVGVADGARGAGRNVFVEPGDRIDIASLDGWNNGDYGIVDDVNRATIAIIPSFNFYLPPATQDRIVLLNSLPTSDAQAEAAPLWIRRGFEPAFPLYFGFSDEAIVSLCNLSCDTDLLRENLLTARRPLMGTRIRNERHSRHSR